MYLLKLIKFDLMNIMRTPMLVAMNTLFPFILFFGFGLVTASKFGGGYISSWDYYGIGSMIVSGAFIGMTVTNTFMEKGVIKGNLRAIYTCASKTEIFLSKLISTYIFGGVIFSIISIILQSVFHSNFGGSNIIYILILINILTLFGCCLGTLICCVFRSEQRANAVMPIVILLFIAFGGIFSPLGHFGKVIGAFSCISPVKWVTECSFKIIYDNDFSLFMPTVSIMLIASVIFVAICQVTFKPEEYV